MLGLHIHPRVLRIAGQRNIDLADLVRAVQAPDVSWPNGWGGVVHIAGERAVITDQTGEIVAVASRERALAERALPRIGAVRRASGGGPGRRYPATVADLLDCLLDRGFEVTRHRKHYILTHPQHPRLHATVPSTPSDRRSIPNAVMQIRRDFGIDVRDPA